MLIRPTIALLLASSASAAAAGPAATAKDSLLVQNVMAEVNTAALEDSIKKSVTNDILALKLEEKIKSEVRAKVGELAKEQVKLQEKWDQLRAFEKQSWDDYRKLATKQKLASLLDSLSNSSELDELWGGVSKDEIDKHLSDVRINFDLKNHKITAKSESVAVDGKALYEWTMEPKTGSVQEVHRQADASHERVIEKTIDPKELDSAAFTQIINEDQRVGKELADAIGSASLGTTDDATLQQEWDEAEAQRDIAFKIMYFFIAFIMCTFSLLYAYFKMAQKQEIEARLAQRQKSGMLDGKNIPMADRETSFADFMTGQFDPNYVVNPYMRANGASAKQYREAPRNTSSGADFGTVAKKGLDIAAKSVSIGLGMGTATLLQAYAEQQQKQDLENQKRPNQTGFGSVDLDHLSNEHRGRFPGIDVDHFEFNADTSQGEELLKKDIRPTASSQMETQHTDQY